MREILRWPWWLSLLILGLDFSIVIAIWAGLGNIAAISATLITGALTIFFYFFTGLTIRTENEFLYVGRAYIERRYLKNPEILTRDRMTYFLREGFNPSGFLAMRFWIKTGIRIEIHDPQDPTPLWIVTCKTPAELEKWIRA